MPRISQSYCSFMNEQRSAALQSFGLLLLRVSLGGMMLCAHGWGKLTSFSEQYPTFPDPLGVGSMTSMLLVIFAEFFCSLAIILGLGTRFAALPLVITMLVAAAVIHADDPWGKKEFALLYLIPFLSLVFTGAGKYSLDALIRRRCKQK